jgi:SAM-dependent methyltransferase
METVSSGGVIPSLIVQNKDILICPVCRGDLDISDDRHNVECPKCKRSFGCENGIPLLFWPNEWDAKTDVTDIVKAFYEETPFPGYDDVDNQQNLREKCEKAIYARLLDEQIPHGARVLEVACGTGQLSNYLGMKWGRTVFAADICMNSLRLGNGFRERNNVENLAFFQMNLFRPVFKPESFQLVICNGALHHTSEPYLGFQTISKLVKKGGHIIIGLYNTYGRIPLDIRRWIFRLSGDRLQFLDARLRDKRFTEKKRHTWLMDQYKHPHESKHSMGEVLNWFDQCGFEFVNGIPKLKAFEPFSPEERLFEPNPRGTTLDRFLVQLGMLLGGGREGGFFIMIGRKKA